LLRLACTGVAGTAIGAAMSAWGTTSPTRPREPARSTDDRPAGASTFADSYDFSGKTVVPGTTHAMSGRGTTAQDHRPFCGGRASARASPVRGEEIRDSSAAIDTWLHRSRLVADSARR
jgi:hypothetical protein